ncbi:MAG: hypothetical protein IPP14_05765 [Planctomycetes bacterium]|nr:hypothetical protein [Planctomycetota bacterium]
MSHNPVALSQFRDSIKPHVQHLLRAYGKTGDPLLQMGLNHVLASMMIFVEPTPARDAGPRQIPVALRRVLRGKNRIQPTRLPDGRFGISVEKDEFRIFLFCSADRFIWKPSKSEPAAEMVGLSARPAETELAPLGERDLSHRTPKSLESLPGSVYWFRTSGTGPLFSMYRNGSEVCMPGKIVAGLQALFGKQALHWRLMPLTDGGFRIDLWADAAGVVMFVARDQSMPDSEDEPQFFTLQADSDKSLQLKPFSGQ